MDTTLYISVCFMALFASSWGLDPLEVKFTNGTKVEALAGATNVHFQCHLNRDAMWVLKNSVDIVHINPVTQKETILSTNGGLEEGMPTYYNVDIASPLGDPTGVIVDFTIKEVRLQDDGIFKCHVHPGEKATSTETGHDEREIVVHRPFSSLKLKFGDFDALEDSPADPIKIDHGEYKVSCVAQGSNPATEDVQLSFHGLALPDSKPVVTPEEGSERKFKTEVNGSLTINVENTGQEVVCQAKDSTGQSKMVKLSISVNTYDPLVSCNDTEAHIGQDNPMIVCTVNYTGLEVDGYAYQLGDGQIIKADDNSNPNNIEVTVEDVKPGISVVSLDLHKAVADYLDKNYYILINMKGGHTSKESVRLSKKEAPVTEGSPSGDGNTNNGGGNTVDENEGPDDGKGDSVRIAPVTCLYLLTCVAALFWSSH